MRVHGGTFLTRVFHVPSGWAVKWNARQVFYKQNMAIVASRQRKMYNDAVADRAGQGIAAEEEAPVVGEVDIEFVGEDGAKDDEPTVPDRPLTLFHFFQRAVTYHYSKLDEEERSVYQELADVWNEEGPSEIEKKRYVCCQWNLVIEC